MSGDASVTAATTTVGSFAAIGAFAGSQGTLTVGGNATFQTGGNRKMLVGESGSGTLNLADTGHVLVNNNVTGDGFRLGALTGGAGTVNLDGGTLEVAYVAQGAGTGTFNFNGGTLKVASNHDGTKAFMSGLSSANVLGGGAVIDSNGFDVTISQALLDGGGGGGLTKQGGGKLTLTGTNTFTGTAVVDGGALVFDNFASVPSVLVNDGSIDSKGSIGSLTVADLATNRISAGVGASGILTVDSLAFLGEARISLGASGSGINQSIFVNSQVTTSPVNGLISVDVTNDLGIWTADPNGWDYTIIDHGGTYTGNVASDFALGNLTPALGAGQTATIEDTGSAIVLRVVGDPLLWTGSAGVNWNSTDVNWTTVATGPTIFTAGQAVEFADGASGFNVNLGEDVAPGTVNFSNYNDDYTISSAGGFGITGSASILIDGGGQVTLQTANSYTGQTAVQDGILILSGNGSVAQSSSILLGNFGEWILDLDSAATYANPITGTGASTPFVGDAAITKQGTGTLTLSGANTFSGSFALNSGQLNLNGSSALGNPTGKFILNGGTLDNTSGSLVTMTPSKPQEWNTDLVFLGTDSLNMGNGVVTLTGTRTANVQANQLYVGAIEDSASGHDLIKTGTGTLVLNGGNIAGDLDIQAGIVGLNQAFYGGAPIGSGILQNAGNVGSLWTYWNPTTDVSTNLLIRNNDGSHNFQLGLIKSGSNTLTLTNPSNTVTANLNVDQGRLVLNAGTYGARNDDGSTNTALASVIGWAAGANAVLEIHGATVNYNNRANPGNEAWRASLSIGNTGTGAGAVKITSGSLSTNRAINLGAGGSYGSLTQTGGSTTVGGFLVLGGGVSQGVVNLIGGTFNHNGPLTNGGLDAGGIGLLNISGTASYQYANTQGFGFWIGEGGNGTLNLSDSATLTLNPGSGGMVLGQLASGGGIVNLLGGTLTTSSISKGAGAGRLNFNGGTLSANAASATFLQGLTSAHVHAGGGTIHNGGNAITIGQALLAPSGNAVSAAGLTVSGGGCIDTPVVTLSGDGNGATAVANIDGSGNLTGITITNPGNDYTAPPTFALVGGGIGNTGSLGGTATLVPAASGGMTFTGAAITTLGGANTYTGNTLIGSGSTVVVSGTAAITVKPAANGVSSKITGAGTVSIDGTLRIDFSEAAIANGNSWTLVDSSTRVFNVVTFKVNGAGLGDFTPQGDGVTHVLADGNRTWTFSETTGVLSLGVTAGGFGTWITGFGLAAADQDPNDDPDQDGIDNLMEYVLGGNPNSANTAIVPSGSKTGEDFILTFNRADVALAGGDVAISVEYGDDLNGWTAVTVPASDSTVSGVAFAITDGSPNDTVTATIPTGGANHFFARVKALK
jgi:autotransporter-associated beta strand protein/T5SS/PEP-CTERM-associated repeat protein